mmetsp:Transcript_48340/g.135493  ORF Transcript_48340/g.135493 Transcript_48340/m.135493 type:complete len:142 (-) Transcript_48340:1175-1600(-)
MVISGNGTQQQSRQKHALALGIDVGLTSTEYYVMLAAVASFAAGCFCTHETMSRFSVPMFMAILSNFVLVWRRTTLSLTLALALLMLGEWRVRALPGEREASTHTYATHVFIQSYLASQGGTFLSSLPSIERTHRKFWWPC